MKKVNKVTGEVDNEAIRFFEEDIKIHNDSFSINFITPINSHEV